MTDVLEHSALERWQRRPISFVERNPSQSQDRPAVRTVRRAEGVLRALLEDRPTDDRLLYPDQCIGWVKKTGKTATSAMHGLVTTLVSRRSATQRAIAFPMISNRPKVVCSLP